VNILQLHWHPANPATTLAGASVGQFSEKWPNQILDLLELGPKSGTTLISYDARGN